MLSRTPHRFQLAISWKDEVSIASDVRLQSETSLFESSRVVNSQSHRTLK